MEIGTKSGELFYFGAPLNAILLESDLPGSPTILERCWSSAISKTQILLLHKIIIIKLVEHVSNSIGKR